MDLFFIMLNIPIKALIKLPIISDVSEVAIAVFANNTNYLFVLAREITDIGYVRSWVYYDKYKV